MKRYIKTNSGKPVLDDIEVVWSELDNGSGILLTIYPDKDSDEVLFEELFDYADVDSDAIYGSALDMAKLALSQKYELTDRALEALGV